MEKLPSLSSVGSLKVPGKCDAVAKADFVKGGLPALADHPSWRGKSSIS